MGDLNTLIVATVPILGVALGAALQFYFSRSAEDRKNLNTLRASAYTDFIRGVSGVAISQRGNDVGQVAANMALVADAKARIAIWGSARGSGSRPFLERWSDAGRRAAAGVRRGGCSNEGRSLE